MLLPWYQPCASLSMRYVLASVFKAVTTDVTQPANLEWAPTAPKISTQVHSGPCAGADFQEE